MYIPVAGFSSILFLFKNVPGNSSILTSIGNSPVLLIVPAFVLIAAMYNVSILVSIRIMEKKEM